MSAMPTVAVIGGSLGGLTAALLLRDLGCDVTVYERSAAALEARGAGIATLEQTLRYPVERMGVAVGQICSSTDFIRFLGPQNQVEHEHEHRYLFSGWNTIYRTLLSALDPAHCVFGKTMTSFDTVEDGARVEFADGTHIEVDLVVCADGISSTARTALLPEVRPRYAGYVAWRGTIAETDLSAATRERLHDALTYQLLPDSHILVYPIPGLDGAVERGRLVNMVWYRNVEARELPRFLTDRAGVERSLSLPPGAVRDDQIAAMRTFASEHLAAPIAEVVAGVSEPFVQAVFDIEVPSMTADRVCLLGDAAFAVRPHAAAGTAKAAEDGWVLAEEIGRSGGDVRSALPRWQERQLALGRDLLRRNREIGDSSQFTGAFRAGDPRLIFGLYGPGQ